MKHLRYDCMGAAYAGEDRHPQVVMRELGSPMSLPFLKAWEISGGCLTATMEIPLHSSPQWSAMNGWLLNLDFLKYIEMHNPSDA